MKDIESTVLVDEVGALYKLLRPVVADFSISDEEESVVLSQWPRILGIFTMCLRVNVNELDAMQRLRLGFDGAPNRPLSEHIEGVLAQCRALRQEMDEFEEGLRMKLMQLRIQEMSGGEKETTGDCSQQSPVGLVPKPLGLSA